MVNGIFSLISLSDLLLLVYRNATNFFVFILYLSTSLFADDMILYTENPKDVTRKLLELINEFGKVAGYKINIETSVVFLPINNKLSRD